MKRERNKKKRERTTLRTILCCAGVKGRERRVNQALPNNFLHYELNPKLKALEEIKIDLQNKTNEMTCL
jgi:hypothetical protein